LKDALEIALENEGLKYTPEGVAALREKILRKAEEVDVRAFLDARLEEYMEMHSGMDILGVFKLNEPSGRFYSPMYDESELIIAKIPAKNPWDLAAWLPMGGFNDCPSPAEQTAVFQYWFEKYGAVPGAVTYDEWELKLTRPPVTDEEAEALAKEHFAFCYDVVAQASSGWNTLRGRASALKNSTAWYFWWD
jgi:hypothetical protein